MMKSGLASPLFYVICAYIVNDITNFCFWLLMEQLMEASARLKMKFPMSLTITYCLSNNIVVLRYHQSRHDIYNQPCPAACQRTQKPYQPYQGRVHIQIFPYTATHTAYCPVSFGTYQLFIIVAHNYSPSSVICISHYFVKPTSIFPIEHVTSILLLLPLLISRSATPS